MIGQAGDTRFPDQVVLPAGNVIVEHQPVVEKTAEAIVAILAAAISAVAAAHCFATVVR